MRFCLLLYADPDRASASTNEEALVELGRYEELTAEMVESGSFISGEALMPGAGAVQVGSMAEGSSGAVQSDRELSGYYVVECETLEVAVALAERMPVAEHGVVEVRSVMEWDEPPGS